ncbi:amidase domain-containing protein, partial [Mycobacterium tuberculosis]|nr:amidase domain-containing protein [Mycobacterium tuberculosis]
TLVDDKEIAPDFTIEKAEASINERFDERLSFEYDRLNAVKYAETWWNSYNPRYTKFTNDCTNFISQCLRAGGAPMTGYPNRSKGWWMQN